MIIKKYFITSFIVTTLIFYLLIFLLNTTLNQDQENYTSKYKKIDAKTILDKEKNKDFVVIIFSTSCPGVSIFMPDIKRDVSYLKKNDISYYLINDDPISAQTDNSIENLLKEYKIDTPVYIFNSNRYKKSGGFFNSKKRYADFVKELCNSDGNGLGYAQYFVFKKAKFIQAIYNPPEGIQAIFQD